MTSTAVRGSRADLTDRIWATAPARALVRVRFGLCAALIVASALTTRYNPADLQFFAGLGRDVLTGHWSAVYASSQNQAGPFQLIASWLLLAGRITGSISQGAVLLVDLCLVAAGLLWLRRMQARAGTVPRSVTARRELVVGVASSLWVTQGGLWAGHPAELAIPLLWFAGLRSVAQGRTVRGAVVFGLASGFAPWAVLATPGFLAVARTSRTALAAVVATAVAAVIYLPFALSGSFEIAGHIWAVSTGSGPHFIDSGLTEFSWRLRLVQAVAVVSLTAVAALVLRRSPLLAPVLAPLCAAALRVLTDPLTLEYYWISIGALCLLALITAMSSSRRLDWRLLALPYLTIVAVSTGQPLLCAVATLGLVVSLTIL